ncbi:MAG: hypothetical protein AMK71_00305 [Nitrospira bacterium SG8_35_4]|nr:MAG: hypothetical protein AMK71_00305 [Nitrospira bacterium SG8_35_4]
MFSTIFKKIGKNTAVYSIGNLLNRLIGFVMIPVYTRYLVPSDYGIVSLIDITINLAATIIAIGLSGAVIRFYYDDDDPVQKKLVISTSVISMFMISIAASSLFILFSQQISYLVFDSGKYSKYLKIAFITLFFEMLSQLTMSYIRAKQQSLRYSLFSLSKLLLGLSLNIYLIVFLEWGVWGVLYSGLITNGIVTVVLLSITFAEVGFRFSLLKLQGMLKFGLPLIPSNIGMFILASSNMFFLQKYSTLSVVGTYSIGYKLGFAVNVIVVTPFLLFWSAYMYEIAKEKNAKELFSKILEYVAFMLIIVVFGLSVIIGDVVKLLLASEYWGSASVVPLIALTYLFWGLNCYFYLGINITKKTKYRSYSVTCGALIALILNYLLIPLYGALGAAGSTALAYLLMTAMNYYFSQRLYPIQYKFSRIVKMSIVSLFLFYVSKQLASDLSAINVILKVLILGFLPIILWALGFYKEEEKQFIKRSFHNIRKRKDVLQHK